MKKIALLTVAYISFLFVLAGCMKIQVFEKNVQIPKHSWSYDYIPKIEFEINDTTSKFNVTVTCRHTEAYAYKNLWLIVSTLQPGDTTVHKERIELTLQDQTGRWMGTGMDDIWEQRIPLFQEITFKRKGKYEIWLEQNMRDNPLLHIMDIGIRIEKAGS